MATMIVARHSTLFIDVERSDPILQAPGGETRLPTLNLRGVAPAGAATPAAA